MTNFFKGDELELKMYDAAAPALEEIGTFLDEFFEQCYLCKPMGALLYDERRVPLTNAIRREVFIDTFAEIFDAWIFSGTFESYLTVFRKIFTNDAVIEFTVPAPGKLIIDIEAPATQENQFIARVIESGSFVFYDMITQDGDFLVFRGFPGIETEYELNKMLFTMVPAGIYTEISLTLS